MCQPDSWTDCIDSQLADLYNNEITSILDRSIPAKTVTTRRRPSDPWFDQECRQSKRDVRRLERLARSTGTPESIAVWNSKRSEYRELLRNKRERLWRDKIDAEKSTPRQLWRSVDTLLGRGRAPPVSDINARQFHRYFDDKVAGVRSETANAPPPSYRLVSFLQFQQVSPEEVAAVIRTLPDKSQLLNLMLSPTL